MKTPDKIFVNADPFGLMYAYDIENHPFYGEEYIRKDALLGWAKELKERWEEPPMSKHSPGCVYMLEQLIDKLNSM